MIEALAGVAAVAAIFFILTEKNNKDNGNGYTIEPTADNSIYKVVDADGNIQTYGTYGQCEEWIEKH